MKSISQFYRLAAANLFAQFAEQVTLAASPLAAVLLLGASVGAVGVLQTVLTLPLLLLALPAGHLADRMSRRRLMIIAEFVRFTTLATLSALVGLGLFNWTILAIAGFVGVCGTVVFSVTVPAIVPALTPVSQLAKANARLETAGTLAFGLGPILAGVLFGTGGVFAAFAAATCCSAFSILLLSTVHGVKGEVRVRMNPLRGVGQAVRFVFGHPLLAPIFWTQFVFNAGAFVMMAVFVPFAVRDLGLSAQQTGVIMGMFGIGLFLGSLLAPMVMRVTRFGLVVAIGPVSGLVGAALVASTQWYGSAMVAAVGFFLLGVGPILWGISTVTLRQMVTPDQLMGRVSAVYLAASGARALGAGLGAVVGEGFGVEAALLTAVLLFLVQAAIILASPAVRLRQLPAAGQQVASADALPRELARDTHRLRALAESSR